ncbi:LysR substrate-binding domain-containing protein [Massilia sp. DWR3-1-1]|uniref:LysR substrate-binding domain-containing protein n=1 Tax=Massilia sp. DWR3-1-1 TaxID=2804559 RepID=UPI003CFB734D
MSEQFAGIAIFVAAARASSFTAAAAQLGMTKSAVGKSIARLEDRLGVRLFHRTTRRITLTVDGAAYFASCAGALDAVVDAERALQSGRQQAVGRVRIDMPSAFGRAVVVPLLADLALLHPQLTFSLSFADHLVDPFDEGIDLLIRFGELGEPAGLVARRLGRQRQWLCAAPAYLARRGVPATIADLAAHDCVVGKRRHAVMKWSLQDGAGAALKVAPPPTHQVGDGDAVLALTLAGCGICQLPGFMVRAPLAAGTLVSVLDDAADAGIAIYALWPQTRHLLPKLRCVIDALEAQAALGAFN